MILDERNEFADATALSTSGTGRALVGDVIDLGAANELNDVDDLFLVIQVDTTVTSGGAATVSFELVSDDAAAIATDGSATVHHATADIGKADLVAGYTVCQVALPKGISERYLGILQNVGTAALTAGAINAFLTMGPVTQKSFPDAI